MRELRRPRTGQEAHFSRNVLGEGPTLRSAQAAIGRFEQLNLAPQRCVGDVVGGSELPQGLPGRSAYTRTQAAEALGISRSTFNRRVLPRIETVEMPWGARLIPADELERLVAEWRRPAREGARPSRPPGRPTALAPDMVDRICAERATGKSLAQIARDLNDSRTPTAHRGRQWWPSTVRAVLVRLRRPEPAHASTRSSSPASYT